MDGRIRAPALAAAALLALAACDRQSAPPQVSPDSSAQTVNVPAAAPSGDPPGTTPVDSGQSQVSKQAETTQMPQEGQDQSYSTLAPTTPQKAGGVDPTQTDRRTQ